MPLWVRIAHWFGRCPRCEVHDVQTASAVGASTVGKIHGWVTRAELRAFADRDQIEEH